MQFKNLRQEISEMKSRLTAEDISRIYTYQALTANNARPESFVDNKKDYAALSFHSHTGAYLVFTIREVAQTDEKIRMRPDRPSNPRAAYAATKAKASGRPSDPRAAYAATKAKKTSVFDNLKTSINEQQATKPKTSEAGWKFHISIEQAEENKAKAWDKLLPILVDYKVGEAKIVEPDVIQPANKVITVYTFKGGPEPDQWKPFLQDVEIAFKEAGVNLDMSFRCRFQEGNTRKLPLTLAPGGRSIL